MLSFPFCPMCDPGCSHYVCKDMQALCKGEAIRNQRSAAEKVRRSATVPPLLRCSSARGESTSPSAVRRFGRFVATLESRSDPRTRDL